MMKNKTIYLWGLLLLFLGIINSCRNDFLQEQHARNEAKNFEIFSKTISLDESQHKAKLLPELKQIKSKLASSFSKNSAARIINYGDSISIDTDEVIYVEYKAYHTYTFRLHRNGAEENAPVENLILSLEPDGTYKELLKTYNLTREDWDELSIGNWIDLEGKTQTIELEKGTYNNNYSARYVGLACHYVSKQVFVRCCHDYHGAENINLWYQCTCSTGGLPRMYSIETLVCEDVPQPPSGGWDPNTNPPISYNGGGDPLTGNNPQPQPENPNDVQDAIDELGGTISLLNLGDIIRKPIITFDDSFEDTNAECILQKMSNDTDLGDNKITLPTDSSNDDLFQKMLRRFNGIDAPRLVFEINNTLPNNSWGFTKGFGNSYNIQISSNVENGSNLMKTVTLSHELIHAFMFDYLYSIGVVYFDSNGAPRISVVCSQSINYNDVNLNSLSDKERFVVLICAMNQNSTLTLEWSHEIFNSNVFDINTYRQKLEQYLLQNFDWNSESTSFKNEAINIFGTSWKSELAKAVSWIGLEDTSEYLNYLNSYSSSPIKLLFIQQIRNKIQPLNNICQ